MSTRYNDKGFVVFEVDSYCLYHIVCISFIHNSSIYNIHLLMEIAIFSFGLLWIKLLQIFVDKSSCGCVLISFSKYLELEFLVCVINLCLPCMYHFAFPPARYASSTWFISLLVWMLLVFNISHSSMHSSI